MATLPKLVAVVGPTASGKTDLSLALARAFRGEVISADSRQLYRGMAIGSATPAGERRTVRGVFAYWVDLPAGKAGGVAHHLMAFRSPADPVTLAGFARMARRKAREIAARGHIPFLVGGSGLFVSAVVDNYAIPHVPPNPKLRAALEAKGTDALFAELKEVDPDYAARVPKENRRYVIRALEVARTLGVPFSAAQGKAQPTHDVLLLGVRREREELYRRIDRRVDQMMVDGLLAETERLGKRYGWELPTLSGLGHRQLGEYLRGETTLAEAVRRIKRDTRRFAKRQMTWFRRDSRIVWVRSPKETERRVAAFLGEK